MKVGLENKKKAAFLAGLLALLGYLAYSNFGSGPGEVSLRQPAAPAAPSPAIAAAPEETGASPRVPALAAGGEEFRPVFRSKRSEQRIDPATIAPALHLELLAGLQEVAPEGGGRNLFQFSTPPPPPAAATAAKLSGREPIVAVQPKPTAANSNAPPAVPPPPPMPLKYYGYSTARASGKKAAFFVDGDEILIGGEGDILEKRYRVVRIGVNSVVMEDMENHRQQPVPLEDNASLPG
jgi:hypothetical protein